MKKHLFFILICILALSFKSQELLAQNGIIKGLVLTSIKEDTVSLPGAHVVVYQSNENNELKPIQTTITDSDGRFTIHLPKVKQKYILNISFLGYKSYKDTIFLATSEQTLKDIFLQEDTQLLNEVRVEQSRTSQSVDNRSYLFSSNEKIKSINAFQLVSALPGLRIDRTTNKLAPVNGGDIRILINGLPASESQLRALPPKGIKRAIIYDVAPAEYDTSGLLINVIVEYPEKSTSGDINLTVGNLYSSFDPVITHVSKRSMWTFGLSSHLNPKNRHNYIKGNELYYLSKERLDYNTDKKEQMYGFSALPSLSYLYSGEKVRIITKASFGIGKEQENVSSTYTAIGSEPIHQQLDSKVKGKSGDASVYIHYNIDKYKSLIFKSSLFLQDNKQDLNSLVDEKDLEIQNYKIKRTTTNNELVFRNYTHKIKYTTGLRSSFNKTSYTGYEDPYSNKRFINTLYTEFWSKHKTLDYRISLFFNHEHNKSSFETYSRFNFTPKWLLSYTINSNYLIRYMGSLSTRRPTPQELSNDRFSITPFMYRSGSPTLRNELVLDNEILLRFTKSKWQVDWSLIAMNQYKPIIENYSLVVDGAKEYILRQPINGKRIDRFGTELYIGVNLLDNNLRIGLDSRLTYFSLERDYPLSNYNKWIKRLAASVGYSYKNLSFEYYQIIYGNDISNLQVSDLEKVSYLSAGYRKGNLGIYASLFFPFGKNKVHVETIDKKPYYSTYDYRMKSKEKTFAISLSWFFGNTAKRLNSNQAIYHSDSNKGSLGIK